MLRPRIRPIFIKRLDSVNQELADFFTSLRRKLAETFKLEEPITFNPGDRNAKT